MNESVPTTMHLQEYKCTRCRRLFYINKTDRSGLDLDFGCPYGCDDNGRLIRDIKAEVTEVTQVSQKTNGEGD